MQVVKRIIKGFIIVGLGLLLVSCKVEAKEQIEVVSLLDLLDEIRKEEVVEVVEEKKYYIKELDRELQDYIYGLCEEYGVPFELVVSIMKVESNYRSNIISKTNDYGLMQINKINHKRLNEKLGKLDYLNPYDNSKAGVVMLGELYNKYDDIHTVLMAYNYGEGGMRKAKNRGEYSSVYSRKIINIMEELE